MSKFLVRFTQPQDVMPELADLPLDERSALWREARRKAGQYWPVILASLAVPLGGVLVALALNVCVGLNVCAGILGAGIIGYITLDQLTVAVVRQRVRELLAARVCPAPTTTSEDTTVWPPAPRDSVP